MALEVELERVDGDDGPSLATPRQESPAPWAKDAALTVVGREHPRLEAFEKVTGRACYTTDLRLPGQLHGAILRSPHPHARVRRVDTSAAEALAGVHAVLSINDALDIGWYAEETPVFDERVRFVGDEVAAVAAETRAIAEDALDLIEVEYEPLPFVTDMRRALDEDAIAIHGEDNLAEEPERYARGDVETALGDADVVVDETYATQTAVHNALEAHATVARWEGGDLVLHESTQSVFAVREQIAAKLGLPQSRVRVIKRHMGGGFGAKQVPWKQTLFAALLARRAGRPVQLVLDRAGESLAVGNRNPTRQRVRLGARRDGRLVAIDVEALTTSGAYSTPGEASNVGGLYQHLYACDNVRTLTRRVRVNLGPAVAFRAPGYVEACFALESAMDELATRLDIDPLELRRRNYAREDQTKGRPWSSPEGLASCYDRLDEAFGWSRGGHGDATSGRRVRGRGLAAHEWMAGSGSPPAYALVVVNTDASVEVLTGTQDIGTGSRTVLGQIAAETLGVPLERITVRLGDTASGLHSPPSAGSFTMPTLGPTVRAAAENARGQLLEAAATLWQRDVAALEWRDGGAREKDGDRAIALADLVDEIAPHTVQGHGQRLANPSGTSIRPFGAQAAEVEVDTETGEVTLLRVVSAPDCGRIVNPLTAGSQVIGGVTQGIGFALSEERVVDDALGTVLNANLEDYLLPTAADVPPIEHAMVDLPDLEANPLGVKGLGELPLIPAAPAILNAIHDATGIRFRELPLSRRRMIEALAAKAGAPNAGAASADDRDGHRGDGDEGTKRGADGAEGSGGDAR